MANFNTIQADAPTPEPATPAPEPEVEAESAPDESEGFDEGHPEGEEPAEEPQGQEIDEDAEYLVDGQLVKGKDLVGGRLMREDYTRKTQELAEERKNFASKIEALEDEKDDLENWATGLQNPARMEVELEANFPEAFAQLKERIIEDALRQAELEGKPELKYYQEARKARLEEEARKAEREASERTEKRKTYRTEVARMRTEFEGWTKSAMEASGLDSKYREAVQDRLIAAHKGEKWTAETFSKAAKHVANLVGATPPKPKEEAKPAVPPVKALGNRPKPAARIAAKEQARKAGAPKSFDQLRAKFGAS